MKSHHCLVALPAGLAVAILGRLLASSYLAAALALALALVLGMTLKRAPFCIGALLIAPVTFLSLFLAVDASAGTLGFILLVNIATALVLGLAAGAGILLTAKEKQ